jgi:HK97 family phage portal protein
MGLFDWLRRSDSSPVAQTRPFDGPARVFAALDNSAELADYLRGVSYETASGAHVNARNALSNMALLRCVSLIANSIGMLPLNILERGDDKQHATEHPLYRLLKIKPNDFQSAFKFKSTLMLQVLQRGNAYARVIRSTGRVIRLIPIAPGTVKPVLNDSLTNLTYEVQRQNAEPLILQAADVLHLSDLSEDGLIGMSRVEKAKEAIGLAQQAQIAAARTFRNGVMAGGALMYPGKLKAEQIANIQASLEQKYSGAENAHKWMVLEEGIKPEKWATTSSDAQHIENRNHQIEEIARAFGVPRPLLMMDDTSWGSGIEQLGIYFVQYGLQHWFTMWEQAIETVLLNDAEREQYAIKFNERALLRGTLKDQAEFFTKALGSGGHSPWLSQNEVRELQDLPKSNDPSANQLESPITRKYRNESEQTTS